MHGNNEITDIGDEPSQDWVRQSSGQGGMAIVQCVGGLVGTSRIHAAATPLAESGNEAHIKRDDPPLLQGLCFARPHERE